MNNSDYLTMYQQSGVMQAICAPLFAASPLDGFSYCQILEDGQYFYLNSDADYFSQLLDQSLMNTLIVNYLNPQIRSGLHITDLGCGYCDTAFFDQRLQALNQQLGKYHGLMRVSIEQPAEQRYIAIYQFTGPQQVDNIHYFYLNQQKLLKEFSDYFYYRMSSFIHRAQKAQLGEQDAVLVTQALAGIEQKQLADREQFKNLNFAIAKTNNITHCKLTSTEKRIISMCYEGKTAKETGDQLQMTQRAIERVFHQLRLKFNCRSKSQLIFKLRELGLIVTA